MSDTTLAGHVDGLHDLAEKLEQTGIPTGSVVVSIHTEDRAEAVRLAGALGLTDRHDFKEGVDGHRDFTLWGGDFDGVQVNVLGDTPKEDQP